MKNIVTFFDMSLKRNWFSIILAIALGVLLCVMQESFGGNFNTAFREMKVAIIDQDKSALSKQLISYLKEEIGMQIDTGKSYEAYSNELLNRELSAIIEINKNLQNDLVAQRTIEPIQVTTINNYANEAFIKAYIEVYMESVEVLGATSGGDSKRFEILIEEMQAGHHGLELISASETMIERYTAGIGFKLTQGFYLNFIFYIGLIIGLMIVTDHVEGTLRRIQSTPMRPMEYILGIALYALIVGSISAVIYIGYLGFKQSDVGLPFWMVAYLLLVFVLIVIGISMICSFIVKTKVGVVFSIYGAGCMAAILGGAYFETNMAPEFMRRLAKIVPHYWYMECIRGMQGRGSYNPMGALIILGLYALFFMLLGTVLFNKQLTTNE